VRASYRAYETGDRAAVDALLADDFSFSSPDDVGIDRRRTSSAAGRTTRTWNL
jgi:ketosteroid isomerase-like protein